MLAANQSWSREVMHTLALACSMGRAQWHCQLHACMLAEMPHARDCCAYQSLPEALARTATQRASQPSHLRAQHRAFTCPYTFKSLCARQSSHPAFHALLLQEFIARHPFPGPGLAVRVLGDVTDAQALDDLRLADEIYINCIKEAGLYNAIWQAFAVLLPCRSVGVQGDQRTLSRVVCLRAVCSSDGMTAECYPFDAKFLAHVSTAICNKVRSVNRVCYDITSKPPGTIEWE